MSRARERSHRTVTRRGPTGRFAGLLVASLALTASTLRAEGLLAPATGGEIGGCVEERARVGAGAQATDPERKLRYWLRLPMAGRVGDGRGVGYTLTLRPSTVSASSGPASSDVRLRQFDYDAGFRVSGIPATTLAGSLSRGRARGERGGALFSETDVSNRSAAMTVAFRPLPLHAAVLERRSNRAWSIVAPLPALRQEERTRTWRLAGQNSRTSLHVDQIDFDDRSSGFDYRAWSAGGEHTLRWGKGSWLQSALAHSERDGSSPFRQRRLEERIHLQHGRPISTEWDLARHESRGAADPVRTEALGAQLDHRPRPWMDWGLAARSFVTRAPAFHGRANDARVRAGLDVRWRREASVQARGDLGVEHRSDRVPGQATLNVIGERHTVGTSRAFLLELPNPDPASVQVRGLDPPTVYVRDVDYGLIIAGNRLEVRLAPASRIRVGEMLEVDYRYTAPAASKGRTTTAHYQLSTTYGPLSLRHGGSFRDNDLDTRGLPVGAPDERSHTTEMDGRWTAGPAVVGVRARHESTHSARFQHRVTEAQADWSRPWAAKGRVMLLATWSRRSGDGGRLDVVGADARADWDVRPWLGLGTQLLANSLHRMDSPDVSTVDGSIDARLRVDALEASLRVRQLWVEPRSPGAMRALSLQLVRRF